ncbi:MAG: hypothetical protein NVSMB27_34410 [Ktedonobacteraceae bacterium]
MQKWEYFRINTNEAAQVVLVNGQSVSDRHYFDSYIAWLGEQSWELVAVSKAGGITGEMWAAWVFKRPKM